MLCAKHRFQPYRDVRLLLEAVLVYMQSLNNIRKNQLKVVGQVQRCKNSEPLDKVKKGFMWPFFLLHM